LIGDRLEVSVEGTNVTLGWAATSKDDVNVAKVSSNRFGAIVVLNDLYSELERRLGGCLENLWVLSTVLLSHDTWEKKTHVNLLCHVEEKTRAVVGSELGANFLKSHVLFTSGLEKEFIEEEGFMVLHVSWKSA